MTFQRPTVCMSKERAEASWKEFGFLHMEQTPSPPSHRSMWARNQHLLSPWDLGLHLPQQQTVPKWSEFSGKLKHDKSSLQSHSTEPGLALLLIALEKNPATHPPQPAAWIKTLLNWQSSIPRRSIVRSSPYYNWISQDGILEGHVISCSWFASKAQLHPL